MSEAIWTHIELPPLPIRGTGKVRHLFELGDYLLMVTSDRLSAFDVVFADGIAGKGAALTQVSRFWFEYLAPFVPHHLVSANTDAILAYASNLGLDLHPWRDMLLGRSMLIRKLRMLPVECVARGYLVGSAWHEYRESGKVCGVALPPGLPLAARLDEPIFTPATKAEQGAHDENISFERVAELVGEAHAHRVREVTLTLFRVAAAYAFERGILLADTKFEFGLDEHDRLTLADEALTPDSSRYWPAQAYVEGQMPPSYDKQIVRSYLETLDWDRQPPAPPLPAEIRTRTAERYAEVATRLTKSPRP